MRKNQFLSPIISPSHSDLLNSRALPRKNFPGFQVYFFVVFSYLQAVFSITNKICFICEYVFFIEIMTMHKVSYSIQWRLHGHTKIAEAVFISSSGKTTFYIKGGQKGE